MCLILFSYQVHQDYPFILLANRDEMYSRPSKALHWWRDYPEILAGKDEQEGGTWLGFTRNGRFAAITNFRESTPRTGVRSRGHLTRDFLSGKQSPEEFLQQVDQDQAQYNGFNLLLGDEAGLYYYSNRQKEISKLEPGYYGLSNHLLNTPWPKVSAGLDELKKLSPENTCTGRFFELLLNDDIAADHLLPDTGVGLAAERMLSPLFIKSKVYGTCASSVLIQHKDGNIEFCEKQFSNDGIEINHAYFKEPIQKTKMPSD